MHITKFPDGQITVALDHTDTTTLKMRINSYEDLFVMKSWADVTRNLNPNTDLNCVIPCLFGQRSDRRFYADESFGLKIIADFINSCEFSAVELFHPHSDVGPALINNSYIKNILPVIHWVVTEIRFKGDITLVSPDAGAYKWVFKIAEQFKLPLVASNKFRDDKGKISLNFSGDVKGKDCLILDDMAEFGNTFINLAKQLKDNGANSVSLYISHFLGGGNDNYKQTILRLMESVDAIYTTNSVRDFDEEDKKLINVFEIF
jgi:ribose-phosphate pyrophosphokinase